jgi:hypothetical protein
MVDLMKVDVDQTNRVISLKLTLFEKELFFHNKLQVPLLLKEDNV